MLPWDIFVSISVISSIIFVPYQAAFDASVVWHWLFIYLGDLIYIISLVLMFFRSYTNSRGEVVSDQKLIIKYYLRTSFIYDLGSVIPFEIIPIVGYANDLKYVMAIFRLNRILRLHHVWTFLCKLLKLHVEGVSSSIVNWYFGRLHPLIKFSFQRVLPTLFPECENVIIVPRFTREANENKHNVADESSVSLAWWSNHPFHCCCVVCYSLYKHFLAQERGVCMHRKILGNQPRYYTVPNKPIEANDTFSMMSPALDIDWKIATNYEKYIISLYWSVTTVTTVG